MNQPFPAVITRVAGERRKKNSNLALEHDGSNEASRPLTAENIIGIYTQETPGDGKDFFASETEGCQQIIILLLFGVGLLRAKMDIFP